MTGSRPGRVWGLVASEAAGRGGRVSAADVCAAAVAAVEVTGAWLSAARGAEAGHPADRGCADPVTELEQLALDPLVSPAVVLGGEQADERRDLDHAPRPHTAYRRSQEQAKFWHPTGMYHRPDLLVQLAELIGSRHPAEGHKRSAYRMPSPITLGRVLSPSCRVPSERRSG